MPYGDRTRPMEIGPRTGRRMGTGASGAVRDTSRQFDMGEFESIKEAIVMEGSKWS